jgi:hypothetical protein
MAEPLISKELFDRVQARLKRDNIQRTDGKEFAFTKLMRCGVCGSGITAEEKLRKRSDGTFRDLASQGLHGVGLAVRPITEPHQIGNIL